MLEQPDFPKVEIFEAKSLFMDEREKEKNEKKGKKRKLDQHEKKEKKRKLDQKKTTPPCSCGKIDNSFSDELGGKFLYY